MYIMIYDDIIHSQKRASCSRSAADLMQLAIIKPELANDILYLLFNNDKVINIIINSLILQIQ